MTKKNEFYEELENDLSNKNSNPEKRYLEEAAFNRIFFEAEKGKVNWERIGKNLVKTIIKVQNYSGKPIEVPVFLEGYIVPSSKDLTLSLFEPKGKTSLESSVDERIEILSRKISYNIYSH